MNSAVSSFNPSFNQMFLETSTGVADFACLSAAAAKWLQGVGGGPNFDRRVGSFADSCDKVCDFLVLPRTVDGVGVVFSDFKDLMIQGGKGGVIEAAKNSLYLHADVVSSMNVLHDHALIDISSVQTSLNISMFVTSALASVFDIGQQIYNLSTDYTERTPGDYTEKERTYFSGYITKLVFAIVDFVLSVIQAIGAIFFSLAFGFSGGSLPMLIIGTVWIVTKIVSNYYDLLVNQYKTHSLL